MNPNCLVDEHSYALRYKKIITVRKLEHVFERVFSIESHHTSFKEIIIHKATETSYHLSHFVEGVHAIHSLNLFVFSTVSSSTHFLTNIILLSFVSQRKRYLYAIHNSRKVDIYKTFPLFFVT